MRRLFLLSLLMLAACDVRVDFPPARPAPSPVSACVLPDRIPAPEMETVRPEEVVAGRPIRFYLLAVTWMPQTCKAGGDGQGDLACGGANPFGWTLHGLWPNSDGRPYPRYCRPAERVSEATIRANLCRTPSVDLVQHEWAAHGTCAWDAPEPYFQRSAALYDGLERPDPAQSPTAGALRDAFARLNPGLPRDAVAVALTDDGWLREARICLDLDFAPRPCPAADRGAPDDRAMRVEAERG